MMGSSIYNAGPRGRYSTDPKNSHVPNKATDPPRGITMQPSPAAAHAILSPAVSLDDDEARAERRLHRAQALSSRLSQYTRGSDRRQVLRTLLDVEYLPRMHELGGVSGVDDIAAAEREAAAERASLNGVNFMQVRDHCHRGGPVDSYFLQTVREVCGHMCDMDGVDADPMALYGGLLLRLCRSASERDALETMTSWTSCRTGELVMLPLGRRHHKPDSTAPLAEPAGLEMYVEGGNVHAKVTMRHELGLYRRTDLESGENGKAIAEALRPWNGLVEMAQRERLLLHRPGATTSSQKKKKKKGGGNNASEEDSAARRLTNIQYAALSLTRFSSGHKSFLRPWVYINVDVVERINFGTGSSVRILHVGIPEDKNRGYVLK
ncbi:hypothetical protein ACHAXA_003582 [Cyclostephanos tholiformis]|uniref:Uncharacterized protein n=1 Tax=Cyclostephanos tholiformis TaxID=382380 RepID=A0ABD3RTU2_9STRA